MFLIIHWIVVFLASKYPFYFSPSPLCTLENQPWLALMITVILTVGATRKTRVSCLLNIGLGCVVVAIAFLYDWGYYLALGNSRPNLMTEAESMLSDGTAVPRKIPSF